MEWLDPTGWGSFIHNIFEGLTRPALEDGPSLMNWKTYLNSHASSLIDDVIESVSYQEQFNKAKDGVPLLLIDKAIKEAKIIAENFIARELKYLDATGSYPIKIEEKFEGIKMSWHFNDQNYQLSFKGRIDRLDTNGKGKYWVLDYKTGKNRLENSKHLLWNGKDNVFVQHAVYGLWALSQLGDQASKADLQVGYYFTSDRGGWERLNRTFDTVEQQFQKLMTIFYDHLRKGIFQKNSKSCGTCDFRMICANLPQERRKIANEPEQIVEITNILREIEES
jgi:hypothetical protein